MKVLFLFLVAFSLLVTCGCSTTTSEMSTADTEIEKVSSNAEIATDMKLFLDKKESVDEIACQKFNEYKPSIGNAVAFMDEDGFWYAAYPKVCIESYETACEEYPENVIPAKIGNFAFAGYFPYDEGFSRVDSYAFSGISNQDVDDLEGKNEGVVHLPISCGRELYAVHYLTTEGKLLILSVNKEKSQTNDDALIVQEIGGETFYTKESQPYAIGTQVKNGPVIWLYSVYPESDVAYSDSDPRSELSQDELRNLLIEVTQEFSQ